MGGVLHVNGVVPDDRGDGGVVAHHRLSTLLTTKLQECLQWTDQNICLKILKSFHTWADMNVFNFEVHI